MTDTSALSKPRMGRFGVWVRDVVHPADAAEIERLGYGALWIGGSPEAHFDFAEPILEQTTTLQLATGVVTTWTADPAQVAESFHRIEQVHPDRFVLGIGVGHPEALSQYRKPLDSLNAYLDKLDEYGVPKHRRLVAALGPRVLALSGRRSAGAHPYLTTPEHTAWARSVLGPDAFLAPEHKVVLTDDATSARDTGRQALDMYLGLRNYLNSWKRMGFTDEELTRPIADRLVDAMIARGTPEAAAGQLARHLDSGADHVPIRVLTSQEGLIPALTALAGPLRRAL